MKLIRKYRILFFLVLTCGASFSQNQISFRQLSVKEGLSQNSVVSITQDSIGYLWMATQDGLNRFDGNEFTIYPFTFVDVTKPDYSNLGKVYTDRKGDVWIIPIDKKLYKFNAAKKSFVVVSSIQDVSFIAQDKAFNYWIGTYENGLYKMNSANDSITKVIDYNALKGTVYNITPQENKVLITTNRKIVKLNPTTEEIENIIPKSFLGIPIEENFSDIAVERNGRTWYGTFGGGLFFKNEQDKVFRRISALGFTDPLPTDLNILSLWIDRKDRLWIATYGRGIYHVNFNTMSIDHYTVEKHNPRALHYNDVLCIYEDHSGTLWFGTDGAGISFYDEFLEKFNSLTNLQTPENINIDVVRAIVVNRENNIWLGTSGKGLTQYTPNTNSWRTFTTINSTIPSNRIMSLHIDDEGDLWIGTQGEGLVIYNEKSGFRHISSLKTSTIWDIYQDHTDNFWLATREHGLIQFDKNQGIIKTYTSENEGGSSLPENNIRVITEDTSGDLWIGTETQGLVKFDKREQHFKRITNDNSLDSLHDGSIKCLYYDPYDILWIGTNGGGISAFDVKNTKFHTYTTKNGLPNNVIYAILPDRDGNFWLSSNKGITKFTPDLSFNKEPIIVNYNNYAGLATEFNTGAYFKDEEGNLYFGGLDGFYWFQPNSIKINENLAKTTITKFSVLDAPEQLYQNTELKYNQNTVAFEFSGLQFSLPQRTNYQYRLVNYEDKWVHSGNKNYVRYTRLPPGQYRFEVKSSNYDGIWNKTPATLSFTIKEPWYFSTYSKAFYLLLLLLVIYGVYWYFRWRWRMKLDLSLKAEEAQRFKELNQLKSKLYTDIAHEFRTPLTLISGPIDTKLREGSLSDREFSDFSLIKRNINRLVSLLDQLLDLAKLDKGKLKLKINTGDLSLFLQSIASSFIYRADAKQIDYQYDIAVFKDVWYDEDIIEKIVTNLLSNAIKYCPEFGICSFRVIPQDKKMVISVKNTIENNKDIVLDKLFTRFYQKDQNTEGAGIGLALVKELIHLHKGDISVAISEDNTIEFLASIPVSKTTYTSFELVNVPAKEEKEQQQVDRFIAIESELETKEPELPILLIVEDHQEVRAFIKSALKNNYQIIEAANGKQGLKEAIRIIPDIILSDIRMPEMDGITMTNTLKNDERTNHIPIILLTAGAGEENELKSLETGADDFITKPFKLRILEKRLTNLITVRKLLRSRYSQELTLQPKDISITSTDELFLSRIQKLLDEELTNPDFNATLFSEKIGMSRMQLHRKILAFTGLSTSAFIRSQRLKQAVQLLKTSDATINEVAYAVGFNTPSYFIKCFKEMYHKTPLEYIQNKDNQ